MGRLSDSSGSNYGALNIGDQRSFVARDSVSKEITRSYTLTRTARPYVNDLCSAYNDGDPRGPWHVDHAGNLRVGDSNSSVSARADMSEIEQRITHQVIAELIADGCEKTEFDRMIRQGFVTLTVNERMRDNRHAA